MIRLFGKNPTSFGGYYLESAEDVNSIISYVKPIEGNINDENKEFYQENEWRYVPKAPEIRQWISKEDYSDKFSLVTLNETAKNYGILKILSNDIKYIFVKTDSEIPIIIDLIQQELEIHSEDDKKILMSRIVSLQSMNVDL